MPPAPTLPGSGGSTPTLPSNLTPREIAWAELERRPNVPIEVVLEDGSVTQAINHQLGARPLSVVRVHPDTGKKTTLAARLRPEAPFRPHDVAALAPREIALLELNGIRYE